MNCSFCKKELHNEYADEEYKEDGVIFEEADNDAILCKECFKKVIQRYLDFKNEIDEELLIEL